MWSSWSEAALRKAAEHSTLAINPIIFAEVSMKFARIEDADAALVDFAREPLPYEAGFLTGNAFVAYKKRGGSKRSPMPDFCHRGPPAPDTAPAWRSILGRKRATAGDALA